MSADAFLLLRIKTLPNIFSPKELLALQLQRDIHARPSAAESVAANKMVSPKLDDTRCNHTEKILNFCILRRRNLWLCFLYYNAYFLYFYLLSLKKPSHFYDDATISGIIMVL
jgi:hypothetical protein